MRLGQSSHTIRLLGLAVGLMLPVLLACESASTQPASVPEPDPEVRVVVKEWSFDPPTIQIPAGKQVKLILENRGQLDHDLDIAALGVHVSAKAGQTAETTLAAPSPGEYAFDCSITGHKEAGMKGSLVALGTGQAPASVGPSTTAGHTSHATVATTSTRGNQELVYRMEGDTKVFDITAQHVQWEVIPNEFVDAYAYNGQLPGPVMRITEGERLRLNFRNELPEPTVVHFHGPSLPNSMDGVPDVTQKLVDPGQSFTYEFMAKPAGTFIYHTHHNSAVQEPKGLYGMFVIEPKSGPRVAYDKEVFQVVSEFGGNYVINGKAFPATEVIEGKVGERVLIRLANLGQMSHPMHLHGHPFKIVATDGYPVPEGMWLTKDVVNIGPGERYDLLIELDNPGTWVFHCHILSHVQNHGVEPGGMITVLKVTE